MKQRRETRRDGTVPSRLAFASPETRLPDAEHHLDVVCRHRARIPRRREGYAHVYVFHTGEILEHSVCLPLKDATERAAGAGQSHAHVDGACFGVEIDVVDQTEI